VSEKDINTAQIKDISEMTDKELEDYAEELWALMTAGS
jgi:hypothetical protein